MQNLVRLGLQGDLAIFPSISQCKTCNPRGGAKFDPRAIPWALLVEAHYIKLHAKFGEPRPYGYVEGDF